MTKIINPFLSYKRRKPPLLKKKKKKRTLFVENTLVEKTLPPPSARTYAAVDAEISLLLSIIRRWSCQLSSPNR